MRLTLIATLGASLVSAACLVAPADVERTPRDADEAGQPPDADEGRDERPGDPNSKPSRPPPTKTPESEGGFYAMALLASQIAAFDDQTGGAPTDDPFSDPNRLLVVLSSDPVACAEPFRASECLASRTTWSLYFTLWPDQQAPGRYDLAEDINGNFSMTIGDPQLICGGGGGTTSGTVVVDAVDARSVRFHVENADLFAPGLAPNLLEGRSFLAPRCP